MNLLQIYTFVCIVVFAVGVYGAIKLTFETVKEILGE